jgi:hypothetical protein
MQTLTRGTRGVNSPTGQSHREAGEGFDQRWLIASEVSGKIEGTSVLLSSSHVDTPRWLKDRATRDGSPVAMAARWRGSTVRR